MMDSPDKTELGKPASLDEFIKEVQAPNIKLADFSEQKRRTYNTRVASYLAIAIWIILGLVILLHLGATIVFSWHLITTDNSSELGEPVKQAYEMVNDTAKTLYSFLGTLTAAVSAYYFNTISRSQSDPPNE